MSIFDQIGDIFNSIGDVFNRITEFFNYMIKFFDYLRKLFTCYLPNLFEYLGAHLKCGVEKIKSFFDCFIYYILEIYGKVIYFPIMLIFYFSESTDMEKSIWDFIEEMDQMIHKSAGIHICHYSDYIQTKCYKCDVPKLKKAPKFP